MTTAVVESRENDHALAWSPFEAFVVEDASAPDVETVVLKMAWPVYEHVRPKRGPGSLVARWVPDPRGEYGLICTWVPDPAEISVSRNG